MDGKLVIFDGWSLNGTQTIERSVDCIADDTNIKNENPSSFLDRSVPGFRKILLYGTQETIHLEFGGNGKNDESAHIIINPKECIICVDSARSVRMKCGHAVLCADCFHAIEMSELAQRKCPICRCSLETVMGTIFGDFTRYTAAIDEFKPEKMY